MNQRRSKVRSRSRTAYRVRARRDELPLSVVEKAVLAASKKATDGSTLAPIPAIRKRCKRFRSYEVTEALLSLEKKGKLRLFTANYHTQVPDAYDGIKINDRLYYFVHVYS